MSVKQGTNHEDVQEMNRALVIRLIREKNICSRADLTRATGLKQSTITNIANDLIEGGLIRETGLIEGVRGRRSIALEFYGHHYKAVGVKLSRRLISVGLFDIAGNEYVMKEQPIPALQSPAEAIRDIVAVIKSVIQTVKEDDILIGIGLALPGPFMSKEGRIILMTEFPGWEQISIRNELVKEFDLPIFTEHDANVGALAEWMYGHRKHSRGTMIYVAGGQGIGAGIIVNGEIFSGSLGTAGEIGHMSINFEGNRCECGNYGCLELYCSTTAMLKQAGQMLKQYSDSLLKADASIDDLVECYLKKDELARFVVLSAASKLGVGLVNIIHAFNPDCIIIGDEVARFGNEFLDTVCYTVKDRILPSIYNQLNIELTSFTRDSALIGAATLATNQLLNRPSSLISTK
jgi:predicted NBD/HSP70 family sugar kinase